MLTFLLNRPNYWVHIVIFIQINKQLEKKVNALKKSEIYQGAEGPLVLVIMDGVGIGKNEEGDMVRKATTPHLDWLKNNAVTSTLKAHGKAVGLPSDGDMGNSEVGHNAIGCGRVFDQGAILVNKAIESGAMYEGEAWKELTENVIEHESTLHFLGLFSDGNVHSHINHLESMLNKAKEQGIKKAAIHILLDGRDVPPTSALEYVERFETFLHQINADGSVDYAIASGGGRMNITMDRYQADWSMVDRGWATHVHGDGRMFSSAKEAIETYRRETPGVLDQDMEAFVIERDDQPLAPVRDHDSVIFFNYRGDRAIEITMAFEYDDFDHFDRGARPSVKYAGMMQYDGDLSLPTRFLVPPPAIEGTMGEYLAKTGVTCMAISETQKFGHVTYFFNGNRSGKFDEKLEDYIEVPSDNVPFEQRPWMKAAEITDKVLEAIESGRYRFIRINYANGDMVGHTGVTAAVEVAVEAVDLCLGRLIKAVTKANGIMIVSADHGNADDMYECDKKTGEVKLDEQGHRKLKTSHSLNPVPVYIVDPSGTANIRLSEEEGLGISSLAATSLKLLGYEPPEVYTPSIVEVG